MSSFILTKRSVILCPHGGMVSHIPMSKTSYRVCGDVPMLLLDRYVVSGCPNRDYPCGNVSWENPSTTLYVNGVPALLNTSIGFCLTQASVPQGAAVIASFQTVVTEPDNVTQV